MKKFIFLFIIILGLFSFSINAQAWKRSPSSIVYANGTNHFLGDLGGGKKEAAHFFGVRDIDYQVTRPTWQIGYRYRFHEYFTVKVNYSYALIMGKDKSSGTYYRQARNLSFRSGIYELTTQVEYYFIKEKGAAKSSFGSLKGFSPLSAYIFVGGGALYFNPKAKLTDDGKYEALQPLGTEGQYANPDGTPYSYISAIDGNTYTTPKPYSRIAAVVSMGIGMKYDLNKQWALGFELSNRYTSTDYLDDAHDKYFNYTEMGLDPGNDVMSYADRHLIVDYNAEICTDEEGVNYLSGKTMRGNPNYTDAYIFALVTVYYKLGSSTRAKPKYL